MEGTIDNRRLVLIRPTSRPVAPRRANLSPTNTESIQGAVVTFEDLEDQVVNNDQTNGESTRPHFSKLTPVYKPGPINAVADIAHPRTKGIEFIKAPIKSAKQSSRQNLKYAVSAELADEQPNHELEYFENNLDTIDLDLTEGNLNSNINIAFEAATSASTHQSANFVEQYFQRDSKGSGARHTLKKLVPRVNLKNIKPKHVYRISLVTLLAGVIAFWSYVYVDTFVVNQPATAEQAQTASVAAAPALTESPTIDTTPSTPSTTGSYAVPADQPKYIIINKLNIDAPIENVGLTTAGAVNTPTNIWDAAWYNGSAKPGQNGAALIDGHSSASHGALFGNLDELAIGDQIQVGLGDGSVITYRVAYTTIVNRDDVDMASMLKPYGGASKGLNIITCIGQWISTEDTLQNRLLVYAQQIS